MRGKEEKLGIGCPSFGQPENFGSIGMEFAVAGKFPRAKRLLKQSGVLGGWGNGSSVNDAGSWGYYWSSTYYNTNNAYILNFNSGSVNPQTWDNKNNGFAVRCVKKSEGKS